MTDPASVTPVVCLHAHAPEYRLPDERYDEDPDATEPPPPSA
jgi:hypothetical protein